jgi:hypothetical protein
MSNMEYNGDSVCDAELWRSSIHHAPVNVKQGVNVERAFGEEPICQVNVGAVGGIKGVLNPVTGTVGAQIGSQQAPEFAIERATGPITFILG